MVPQISSVLIVHNQVQILAVLESIGHVDDERVVQLGQKVHLVENRRDRLLANNFGFAHFFHRVDLLVFLSLNFETWYFYVSLMS